MMYWPVFKEIIELRHEIYKNVVCATRKATCQNATLIVGSHMSRLISFKASFLALKLN